MNIAFDNAVVTARENCGAEVQAESDCTEASSYRPRDRTDRCSPVRIPSPYREKSVNPFDRVAKPVLDGFAIDFMRRSATAAITEVLR